MEAEVKVKAATLELAECKSASKVDAPTAALPENVGQLSVSELQAKLTSYGVDTSWDPTEGKDLLVDRLTVRHRLWWVAWQLVSWCLLTVNPSSCSSFFVEPVRRRREQRASQSRGQPSDPLFCVCDLLPPFAASLGVHRHTIVYPWSQAEAALYCMVCRVAQFGSCEGV